MTLGKMRANGVRSLAVSCWQCHHRLERGRLTAVIERRRDGPFDRTGRNLIWHSWHTLIGRTRGAAPPSARAHRSSLISTTTSAAMAMKATATAMASNHGIDRPSQCPAPSGKRGLGLVVRCPGAPAAKAAYGVPESFVGRVGDVVGDGDGDGVMTPTLGGGAQIVGSLRNGDR
jgi:hypothetical protein